MTTEEYSRLRGCKYKLKLSPEEAAGRIGMYAEREPGLEIYLCQHCSWLHFGHPQTHPRVVARKRRKAGINTPSWMTDPRGYAGASVQCTDVARRAL